ncbi:MAG: phage major capsid protein [Actinomycetota bacterium]|nr:phage major capsid protein [Actinomycetota bacterium]
MTQLNMEHAGLPFPDEARDKFAGLVSMDEEIDKRVTELRAREAYIAKLAGEPNHTERVDDVFRSMPKSATRGEIYDLSTIRSSVSNPEAAVEEMADRAKRANELAGFPQAESRTQAQAHVEKLIASDDERGTIARRVLTTGSPTYQRAFQKRLFGQSLTNEEARALSLTGSSGGMAVPFDLDPTIIPTSNGVVNPIRQLARIVQTTVDTWRGVSSGAITATYEAEATETTDNSPVLTQPEISTERAQAFIPFSIEIGMDWPGLRAEMGVLLQDAKDQLEASKFLAGTGTNEPFGVLTGTTNTVNAATGADAFTYANLTALAASLPPRYRPRAAFLGNLAILNRIRDFSTAGGGAVWEPSTQEANPDRLLGKPVYEASMMPTTAGTGEKFMLYGDFSRYVIVDRIGLEIELIPHLFGLNRRPTGQRGLYAFWRNGAKVVDANAFRALLGTA